MQDKLYSRWRIKIPLKIPKCKKIRRFRLIVVIFIFIILGSIISFVYSAYPIFKASCETAASSTATKIINTEVVNIMKDYTYNDLTRIEKDSNGNIKLIEANIIPMNQIIAEIVANIQEEIDSTPRTTVFINMGSITGMSVFTCVGPKFDIELETAGMITTDIITEFQSVGINQTLHKIYLNLETRVAILTPLGTFDKVINSKVLLTEAVIVGEVPSSYYDFDGITEKGEALEVIE